MKSLSLGSRWRAVQGRAASSSFSSRSRPLQTRGYGRGCCTPARSGGCCGRCRIPSGCCRSGSRPLCSRSPFSSSRIPSTRGGASSTPMKAARGWPRRDTAAARSAHRRCGCWPASCCFWIFFPGDWALCLFWGPSPGTHLIIYWWPIPRVKGRGDIFCPRSSGWRHCFSRSCWRGWYTSFQWYVYQLQLWDPGLQPFS